MDFRKVRNSIDSVVMDYAIHRVTFGVCSLVCPSRLRHGL